MNYSWANPCDIGSYLNLCAYSKIAMLVPGLGLNLYVLVSLVSSLCSSRRQIKRNVAAFVFGSTICNLVSLVLWPLTIHWKTHGKWLLGSRVCEMMVKVKQFTSSGSFHYAGFISLSVYLTVVWGRGRLVNSRTFLVLHLISPYMPVMIKEVCQWMLQGHVRHLDTVQLTCFSYINDQEMNILLLLKLVLFIPLNLYFYAHILVTIFRSAKQMQRNQAVNKRLAKIFSIISLLTLTAHIPGGVFSLMDENTVCQEMIKEFLMDLPHLSSPIVLLCTNKELRTRCVTVLKSKLDTFSGSKRSTSSTHCSKTPETQQGETPQSSATGIRLSQVGSVSVAVIRGQGHPAASAHTTFSQQLERS